ncbi:hypothetical protein JL720_13289 [Aureococcus anophagefferens]|nr:hypothetical protein JL720_13289 [Aureococcus anophagefferens]
MHLLRLLGVPYVVAPMEAEAQCAALEAAGLCEASSPATPARSASARRVYKNIFDDRKYVEAYYASDCARDLRLGRDEFCALALLLGGDYDNGVAGVGVVNAMEVLQAFHFVEDGEPRDVAASLTRFKAWLDGGDGWADDGAVRAFAAKHRSARARWETPPAFPSERARAYLRPQVHDVDAVRRQLGGDDDGDDDRSPFKWGRPARRACARARSAGPGAPKGRRSAYIFFGNAKRAEKPYAALATADAERYDREMAAYKATRPAAGAAEEEDEDEEGAAAGRAPSSARRAAGPPRRGRAARTTRSRRFG